MKIKINNIFKNVHDNKYKDDINLKRRKTCNNINNFNNSNEELNKFSKHKEENKEYRRSGARNNKNIFSMLKTFKNKFAVKRSYYILFTLMTILAAVSVYTNFLTYRGTNNESYEVFNSNDETDENVQSSTAKDSQDLTSNNIDTRKDLDNQNVSSSTVVNTSIKTTTSPKETIIPLSFVKPINGEIIKTYSEDKLLFSKTLESWKTHDGVDIKADLGESVKSVEKGIVEKVYEDSFLGMTIIIDHGQGYKSIYSNLDSDVNVKEKQIIKKSTVIGKVGQTSIGEIKDEPHIHFMLMLNNKVIDPTSKIKL